MKKKILCLLAMGMVFGNLLVNVSANGIQIGSGGLKHSPLYEEYKKAEKGDVIVSEGNLYEEMTSNRLRNSAQPGLEDFKEILEVANGDNELIKVAGYDDLTYDAVIAYDEQTKTSIYMETTKESEPIYLEVNDCIYYLKYEGFKVYLVSENGNKLLISETFYNESKKVETDKSRASALKDTVYTSSNDKAYSKDIGPMSTTNKSLLKAVSLLGQAAGWIKASHPIIGAISVVCKVGVKVGDTFYQTFYIRFWRAQQINVVGGLTRNKERWFSSSNCSNSSHVKNHTAYFNSTRPGY
ncbi:MAG: hypothetical protein RR630_03150 [Coprobacillus sp.]